MRSLVLAMAVLLTACETLGDPYAAEDDAKCMSYGAPRGSYPYYECRMALEQRRAAANAQIGYGLGLILGSQIR